MNIKFLKTILTGLVLSTGCFVHATIISVDQSDFVDFQLLDFNIFSKGIISNTDSRFTDFGLTSVSVIVETTAGEEFSNGSPGIKHALWGSGDNDLYISDGTEHSPPPAPRPLARIKEYEFNFETSVTRAGFYFEDVWRPVVVIFSLDGDEVGRTGRIPRKSFLQLFGSDTAFNKVVLQSTSADDGWGVSQVIVDRFEFPTQEVPEPSTVILLLLGIVGLSFSRYKKKS
jgi:hypothetical protein